MKIETLKDILLAITIAILIPVTLYWGINIIIEHPKYTDYVRLKTHETFKGLSKTEINSIIKKELEV